MGIATPAEKQPEQLPRVIGRDELNLAEFPLTALAHRVPDGCRELVFQDRIRDQTSGDRIVRKLTVTGDAKYGLPTALDDDVIVALMQTTKEANDFRERTVPFSRMAIVELLGWAKNGQSLRRLDESLHRWLGVTLRYEKAWWDKAAQTWVNESFHIIDNVTIYDQQTARRFQRNSARESLPLSSFAWNEIVFRSFQAQNLKRLDLSTYFRLSLAPARRAYRFLDKRFYRSEILRFDLRDFACEHIGFSRDYTAAKIKEKLQPALDELEAIRFLEPMSREKRYEKVGRGQWKIVFIRRGAEEEEPDSELLKSPEKPAPPPLVMELVHRGVTQATAVELVQRHPAETIQAKLEVFDWLMEKQDKRVAKSPAGYLVKSISDDYAAPKGFESRAARQSRAAAERQTARQAAEQRRRQQEQAARDQAEREAVDAYLQGLTPAERKALEAEALARADPEMRRGCEQAPARLRASLLRNLLRAYVAQELLRGAIPAEA
jgi:Replication initiator protein A